MLDDYADLKIRCLKAEMANECHVETILQLTDERDKARAELAKYKRALELACQFSTDPEQTKKAWLKQVEKEE